ncbi:MAG: carbon-nitrogen hydrolase family protein [Promethearchaeota archaeon]
MNDIIKVACIQFAFKFIKTYSDFVDHVKILLQNVVEADFAVFPENFTAELQYLIPNRAMNKLPEFTDQYKELFSKLADEFGMIIIAGTHLNIGDDGNLYNSSFLFFPDGKILKHDKTHLFPIEKRAGITMGNELKVFNTNKGKIAIAICYEMEFPEITRLYTINGAEIVFCPSNTIGEHGFWRVRHCCQARAIENQIYVVHSSMIGKAPLNGMDPWGKSSILSPCELPWPSNGVIKEAEANKEMVITANLDLKLLHKKRKRGAALNLVNRRPELYNLE